MKSIVITGANGGIGFATTQFLIKKGYRVFGSVRREEEGKALAQALGPLFVPMVFDVRDEAAVSQAAETVRLALGSENLTGLINNAAVSIAAPVFHQSLEDVRLQLDTNLLGPFIVTKAFGPLLGRKNAQAPHPGRMINIGSFCGRIGLPFGSAYCAAKHGLEGFTESLRREMYLYGVPVVIVAPGLTKTPVWGKVDGQGLTRFDATPFGRPYRKALSLLNKTPRKHGMESRRVADAIWRALTVKNPRRRYTLAQTYWEQFAVRALPRGVMDRAVDRWLRLSGNSAQAD